MIQGAHDIFECVKHDPDQDKSVVVRVGVGFGMSLTVEQKKVLVADFGLHEKDTGSPEIQVALLTNRIEQLTDHLKTHKKDHASRRGLLKMVGARSSLLKYLTRTDRERYQKVIARLGLRK